MYLAHYRLDELPFRNTPDPRFFLPTQGHQEAMANLLYGVEQRKGFVLLSGEIGSGKTLITHLLLEEIQDHATIALIRNTHLNSTQLIRLICDEFNVPVHDGLDKAAMLLKLNAFLVQQLTQDRLVVILIDEAQNLSDKVLEELRMLSNLETSSEKLIQLVLVGQPELREKIAQPNLEQLRQRIALTFHLEPLNYSQSVEYIMHRLKVAGKNHRVTMPPETLEKIHRFSRGTPRIINGLCDNLLLYGFTAGVTHLEEALVERVLRQSMHLVARSRRRGNSSPPPPGENSPFRATLKVPLRPASSSAAPSSPAPESVPWLPVAVTPPPCEPLFTSPLAPDWNAFPPPDSAVALATPPSSPAPEPPVPQNAPEEKALQIPPESLLPAAPREPLLARLLLAVPAWRLFGFSEAQEKNAPPATR